VGGAPPRQPVLRSSSQACLWGGNHLDPAPISELPRNADSPPRLQPTIVAATRRYPLNSSKAASPTPWPALENTSFRRRGRPSPPASRAPPRGRSLAWAGGLCPPPPARDPRFSRRDRRARACARQRRRPPAGNGRSLVSRKTCACLCAPKWPGFRGPRRRSRGGLTEHVRRPKRAHCFVLRRDLALVPREPRRLAGVGFRCPAATSCAHPSVQRRGPRVAGSTSSQRGSYRPQAGRMSFFFFGRTYEPGTSTAAPGPPARLSAHLPEHRRGSRACRAR